MFSKSPQDECKRLGGIIQRLVIHVTKLQVSLLTMTFDRDMTRQELKAALQENKELKERIRWAEDDED